MASVGDLSTAEWRRPTRWSHAVHRAKARLFQLRRALADLNGPRRLAPAADSSFQVVLGHSQSALAGDVRPEERLYELGKIENLRQAARRLDGICVPAGQVFSFWRQLGPATASRGFVIGRMLQEGCLVPAVGGGLCQLSNALFDAALQSGCEIVECHRHSRLVPGSAAALGRDATVAWNYVDLRFRAPRTLRIGVRVEARVLDVVFTGHGEDGPFHPADVLSLALDEPVGSANSCATCDAEDCFRREADDAN
jgi:hypothetical protein